MAKVQITGGAFQDATGAPLALGYLLFELSQDAQVSDQEVCAGSTINIPLNSSGSIATSPVVSVWPNDQLSPAGTFYNVSAFTAAGQLVWGPNPQQVLSSPSPFDIGAWIPNNVSTDVGGSLSLPNATVTTSATAGSASALPGAPAGYVTVFINGSTVKLPFYN